MRLIGQVRFTMGAIMMFVVMAAALMAIDRDDWTTLYGWSWTGLGVFALGPFWRNVRGLERLALDQR